MTARIYVGTYAKYNNGSIAGAWLDLSNYADAGEFILAARELHKDEADPELMFQDYEGFPAAFYSESCIKSQLWDYLELNEDDRKLLDVYQSAVSQDGDIDDARDAFNGIYDSPEDWAAEFLESTGQLAEIPENLRNYFDYEAFARDCGFEGWTFHRTDVGVYVFAP